MRFWIPTLLLLPLTTFAQASDPNCSVSFDSAVLDTCSGEVQTLPPELTGRAETRAASSWRPRWTPAPARARA